MQATKDSGRKYTTTENTFPKERKGCLNVHKLKKFGMLKEKLRDPFFFYNLIYPTLGRKSFLDDPRKNYYSDVIKFTNVNLSLNKRPLKGHVVPSFGVPELVHWDDVNFYNGADKGCGNFADRWNTKSNSFQKKIYECMGYSPQWLETKQFLRWNYPDELRPTNEGTGIDSSVTYLV